MELDIGNFDSQPVEINREVRMDKVGISDYMTALDYSEIPETE